MRLTNKAYDTLKWIVVLLMPAIGALYSGLSEVWGWPMAAQVTATLDYIGVFLGIILGISTAQYNKQRK